MSSTRTSIVRIITVALLFHMALSWPLWNSKAGRTFPILPLLDLPVLSSPWWEAGFLFLMLFFCGLALLFPRRREAIPGLLVALAGLILQDVNRLQPWLYFYLLSLTLILVSRSEEQQQNSLRWLLAAVYAWGGFNKLTPYFAVDNFPWFCEAFVWTKPLGNMPMAGYGIALVELLFAPGLLWPVSRNVFRWAVPAFHLFIVAALSPLGLNWNWVVIPWNVAMGVMVWLLFFPDSARMPNSGVLLKGLSLPHIIPLLLAGLMPLFNLFHCWDEPLSWKMYSNTQTEASFFKPADQAPCAELSAAWQTFAYDRGAKLLVDDWAFDNLHVPAYNSRRTHRQLTRYLCHCLASSDSSGMLLLSVRRWDRSRESTESITCRQVQQ